MKRTLGALLLLCLGPPASATDFSCSEGRQARSASERARGGLIWRWCVLSSATGELVAYGPVTASYVEAGVALEGRFERGWPAGTWRGWSPQGDATWEVMYQPGAGVLGEGKVLSRWLEYRSIELWAIPVANLNLATAGRPSRVLHALPPPDWGRPHGAWITYYPDGEKQSETHYRAGLKHGAARQWFPDGRTRVEEHFRDGLSDGLWQRFDEHGAKLFEAQYRTGDLLHLVEWNPDGTKLRERLGALETDYRRDGSRLKETHYGVDRQVVKATHFYLTGQTAVEAERTGARRHGRFKLFHRNGQLWESGEYRENKRHGRWLAYRENGQPLSQIHYVDGERHGPWTLWRDDGSVAEQGAYAEGAKQGRWLRWHATGAKRDDGEHVRGLREGTWKAWYANGRLREQGLYAGGIKVGLWHAYYADGTPLEMGHYGSGGKTGHWIAYHANGEKRSEADYEQSKLHGVLEQWLADGRIELEAKYEMGRRVETPAKRNWLGRFSDLRRRGPPALPSWSLDCSAGTHPFEDRSADGRRARGCVDENDDKHGRWAGFYADEGKWFEAEYDHGRPVGTRRSFFRSGLAMSVEEYRAGRRHGRFDEWYPGGGRKREARYANGSALGVQRHWHENGVLSREETFDDSSKKLRWTHWGLEGELLQAGEPLPDGEHTRVISYAKDSGLVVRIESRRGPNPDGPVTRRSRNGYTLEQGRSVQGRKDGLWFSWKPDGSPATVIDFREGIETRSFSN